MRVRDIKMLQIVLAFGLDSQQALMDAYLDKDSKEFCRIREEYEKQVRDCGKFLHKIGYKIIPGGYSNHIIVRANNRQFNK